MATPNEYKNGMVEKYKGKSPKIFTLEGYIDIVRDHEDKPDVFYVLSNLFSMGDVDNWKDYIPPETKSSAFECLSSYWKEKCNDYKSRAERSLLKYMEIFSLLENVFRNTLLRPFIPAYRTINTDCGRYSCFVRGSTEKFFQSLSFTRDGDLLTYKEEDPVQTILCAYTCTVFWYHLSVELIER